MNQEDHQLRRFNDAVDKLVSLGLPGTTACDAVMAVRVELYERDAESVGHDVVVNDQAIATVWAHSDGTIEVRKPHKVGDIQLLR